MQQTTTTTKCCLFFVLFFTLSTLLVSVVSEIKLQMHIAYAKLHNAINSLWFGARKLLEKNLWLEKKQNCVFSSFSSYIECRLICLFRFDKQNFQWKHSFFSHFTYRTCFAFYRIYSNLAQTNANACFSITATTSARKIRIGKSNNIQQLNPVKPYILAQPQQHIWFHCIVWASPHNSHSHHPPEVQTV